MKSLFVPLLCLACAPAFACPAVVATPQPPETEGLAPARLVRIDSRAVGTPARQEMFEGTRMNDSPQASRQIFAAPPRHESSVDAQSVQPGTRTLEVVEVAAEGERPETGSRISRQAQRPRPLTIEVQANREYAIAIRRDGNGRRSDWQPVVWRETGIACGE